MTREIRNSEDRRDYPRWPIMVEVTLDSSHTFYLEGGRGHSLDLSEGGIFIASNRPQARGTRFRFQFTLPDSEEPIKALGEVQWCSRQDPQAPSGAEAPGPSGMGVRFMEIAEQDLERIRAFLQVKESQRSSR